MQLGILGNNVPPICELKPEGEKEEDLRIK